MASARERRYRTRSAHRSRSRSAGARRRPGRSARCTPPSPKRFGQHPDAEILRSLPGLGIVLGARVLGEFGDDPDRYADSKARKNYAGTAPITRASGKRLTVLARFVRNRRLTDPLVWWAFCSSTCSPGARACYDRHRARGATHQQALRALANRWVGILHGCLRHRACYDELTAWPPASQGHAA